MYRNIFFIIIAFLLFLLFKSNFAFVVVNGDSMEPQLSSGDVVIIKKKIDQIKHHDIVVINNFNTKSDIIIKRCAGCPGDIITQVKNYLIILYEEILLTKLEDGIQKRVDFDSIINYCQKELDAHTVYYSNDFTITTYNQEKYSSLTRNANLEINGSNDTTNILCDTEQFTKGELLYQIPYKSYCTKLGNENNLIIQELYEPKTNYSCIYKEIKNHNNEFYECKYTQNHYYVLGDNYSMSYDSRKFGFISRNQIIGKAIILIYPLNKIKTKFDIPYK